MFRCSLHDHQGAHYSCLSTNNALPVTDECNNKLRKENSNFPYRVLHCNSYCLNQQMHTTVIRFTTIFLKTLNSYMFRTLLVHQGAQKLVLH